MVRLLNGRAIGHRVGKGDAELEGIGTRVHDGVHNFKGVFRCGIAEHRERNERALILFGQVLEQCIVSAGFCRGAHYLTSSVSVDRANSGCSASVAQTWPMSLSPLPERQTKILMSSSPRFKAHASA